MPVTMEICEEGRVLFLTYSDPVTLSEIGDLFPANLAHRDSVNHTVHTVFDFVNFQQATSGLLRARYAPVFTHPRSGYMIVYGANPLVQRLVLEAANFTGSVPRVKFFDTVANAWEFTHRVIGADKQNENPQNTS